MKKHYTKNNISKYLNSDSNNSHLISYLFRSCLSRNLFFKIFEESKILLGNTDYILIKIIWINNLVVEINAKIIILNH